MQIQVAASDRVRQRLIFKFQITARNALANNRAPKEELNLLAHMPRLGLLARYGHPSPLVLGIKPANVDVLNTLAVIFGGGRVLQKKMHHDWDTFAKKEIHERAAARALFFIYLGSHPTFWEDLITIASLVAIKANAKAALNLLGSIINATWTTAEQALREDHSGCAAWLPTESQLKAQCTVWGPNPLARHALDTVLGPPSMGIIVPHLLKGPENDSEEAYEVAVAKLEVLKALLTKLDSAIAENTCAVLSATDSAHLQDLLKRRIAQGPRGPGNRGAGNAGASGLLNVATESR